MSFAPGQVWTYPETEDVPQLLVTIGRIDSAESLGADPGNSDVISVSLRAADEDWPSVGHLPFAAPALEGGELVMEDATLPDGFTEGYETWQAAFRQGDAGVFTIGPAAAFATVLEALSAKE
ncbi:hypothetical protein C8N43_0625 [Litoreibacter ponti]|uniref:Uncharacterized protein n=1 Tax=Litoreibacter ponti TaxID=1510457 RepID=A0A2T6BIV1_9RHOB|nr:hypothetical protein [Litoreibacter ponti]PTX55976.1 hypothetical protein C8N43_0625 [Litoreibacter ponti]